jgi:hypothetical protein
MVPAVPEAEPWKNGGEALECGSSQTRELHEGAVPLVLEDACQQGGDYVLWGFGTQKRVADKLRAHVDEGKVKPTPREPAPDSEESADEVVAVVDEVYAPRMIAESPGGVRDQIRIGAGQVCPWLTRDQGAPVGLDRLESAGALDHSEGLFAHEVGDPSVVVQAGARPGKPCTIALAADRAMG